MLAAINLCMNTIEKKLTLRKNIGNRGGHLSGASKVGRGLTTSQGEGARHVEEGPRRGGGGQRQDGFPLTHDKQKGHNQHFHCNSIGVLWLCTAY